MNAIHFYVAKLHAVAVHAMAWLTQHQHDLTLKHPHALWLILLLAPMFVWGGLRRRRVPHTSVALHAGIRSLPLFAWTILSLACLSWTLACLSMAEPQLKHYSQKNKVKTRDIGIISDISSSMKERINDPAQSAVVQNAGDAKPDNSGDNSQQVSKIDVAKEAMHRFIARRQGDRIALICFESETYYAWPLTTDLDTVQGIVSRIDANGGGTNFDGDGVTQPLGALQGGINHLRPLKEGGAAFGQSQTRILIMVTDGESYMNDKRKQELNQQMVALGIRLYVIAIGENWVNGSTMTKDLREFVANLKDASGKELGMILPVGDAQQLRAGFDTIDALEKSTIEIEKTSSDNSLARLFMTIAAGFGLASVLGLMLVRDDI